MEGPNSRSPLFLGKWVTPTPIRPLHPLSMGSHNGAVEGQLSKRWGGNTHFGTLSDPLLGICGNMKSKAKIFTDHMVSITSWKIYLFHFACIYLFTTEAIKHFLISSDFFIKQKHKVQENSDKRILQKRRNARRILV